VLGVNVAKLIYGLFCVLFNNTVSNGDNIALVIDECISMEQWVVIFMRESWNGLMGKNSAHCHLKY
jgi:hypothetical protein